MSITFSLFFLFNFWRWSYINDQAEDNIMDDFIELETKFNHLRKVKERFIIVDELRFYYTIYTNENIVFRTPMFYQNDFINTTQLLENIKPNSKLTVLVRKKDYERKGKGNILENIIGSTIRNETVFLYVLKTNKKTIFEYNVNEVIPGQEKIKAGVLNWSIFLISVFIMAFIGFKFKYIY